MAVRIHVCMHKKTDKRTEIMFHLSEFSSKNTPTFLRFKDSELNIPAKDKLWVLVGFDGKTYCNSPA